MLALLRVVLTCREPLPGGHGWLLASVGSGGGRVARSAFAVHTARRVVRVTDGALGRTAHVRVTLGCDLASRAGGVVLGWAVSFTQSCKSPG